MTGSGGEMHLVDICLPSQTINSFHDQDNVHGATVMMPSEARKHSVNNIAQLSGNNALILMMFTMQRRICKCIK